MTKANIDVSKIIKDDDEDDNEEKNDEDVLTMYSYINNGYCFEYFIGLQITSLIGYSNVTQALSNVSKQNKLDVITSSPHGFLSIITCNKKGLVRPCTLLILPLARLPLQLPHHIRYVSTSGTDRMDTGWAEAIHQDGDDKFAQRHRHS